MALLEVRGLVKRFLGVTAVDGVDLTVEPGELVSLIGPNGSGKTTLFNCVTGYLPADGGRISFRGQDAHRRRLARAVGADEPKQVAAIQVQIDGLDREQLAVFFC